MKEEDVEKDKLNRLKWGGAYILISYLKEDNDEFNRKMSGLDKAAKFKVWMDMDFIFRDFCVDVMDAFVCYLKEKKPLKKVYPDSLYLKAKKMEFLIYSYPTFYPDDKEFSSMYKEKENLENELHEKFNRSIWDRITLLHSELAKRATARKFMTN